MSLTVCQLSASPTGNRAGIKNIPGIIVTLSQKNLAVYPDEELKPHVGEGVNVPARVTLENCYCIDKTTRQIVTDETDPMLDRHVERLKKKANTTFLGFNPHTGLWKFEIKPY